MKIVAGLLVFLVSQSNRNQFWFLLEVSVLVSAPPLSWAGSPPTWSLSWSSSWAQQQDDHHHHEDHESTRHGSLPVVSATDCLPSRLGLTPQMQNYHHHHLWCSQSKKLFHWSWISRRSFFKQVLCWEPSTDILACYQDKTCFLVYLSTSCNHLYHLQCVHSLHLSSSQPFLFPLIQLLFGVKIWVTGHDLCICNQLHWPPTTATAQTNICATNIYNL